MALDFTPGNFNPNQPIPNGPFFWPATFTLQSGGGNLIVGTGLEVDAFGRLNSTGGGGGGVSSVGLSSSTLFVTGSPITSSGTIDVELRTATSSRLGGVKIGPLMTVLPDGTIGVINGSTTTPGVVQLQNTLTSTSSSLALTAAQGYLLQQQINALQGAANTFLGGLLNAQTGLVTEVTPEGTAKGLVVGSTLPIPNAPNAGVFVVVSVASNNYTPPGSVVSYSPIEGDQFLMTTTSWIYLPTGYNPVPATTTEAGVVRLATVPEVTAGTNNTIAVTPFGLAQAGIVNGIQDTIFTQKGSLITSSAPATPEELLVGTDGFVLTANSAAAFGVSWGPSPGISSNILTAKGAIIVAASAGVADELLPGTDGYVLTVDSTAPDGIRWEAPSAGNPAAPVNSFQYNDNGNFGGSADLTFVAGEVLINNIGSAVAATGYTPTVALDLATKEYVDSQIPVGGVSQIVAGTNVTISPIGGTGVVTVNAAGTGPAGANTQVQFNDNGNFGASANFTFDTATDTFTVGQLIQSIVNTDLTIQAGVNTGAASPGQDLILIGGYGGDGFSGGAGGNVRILGGVTGNASDLQCGAVTLIGGSSPSTLFSVPGGNVNVTGGTGSNLSFGGDVNITGGDVNSAGNVSSTGGNVNIVGGPGRVGGPDPQAFGTVTISGGIDKRGGATRGNVAIINIAQAITQPGYTVTTANDVTDRNYIDNATIDCGTF